MARIHGKRRYAPIVILTAAGMMAQLSGCGAAGTSSTAAPAYNSDGSVIGSRVSSSSSPNYNNSGSSYNNSSSSYASTSPSYGSSTGSTLPTDPNNLGGTLPSSSPLPGASLAPGAIASPSAQPLPGFAPPSASPGTLLGTGANAAQQPFGSAKLKAPLGLAVRNGKVYVADSDSGFSSCLLGLSFSGCGKVQIFDSSSGSFVDYFMKTTFTSALPKTISGVAVGSSNIYVADPTKGIYVYDLSPKYQRLLSLTGISALTASNAGNVFVATAGGVSKFDGQLNSINANFTSSMSISPAGVAVDPQENLYVTDNTTRTVIKFDGNGNRTLQFDGRGSDGSGQIFGGVGSLAVDARNGDIYVIDTGTGSIRRFDNQGHFKGSFGTLGAPKGISLDSDGTIYVSDMSAKDIAVFTAGQ